MIITMLYAIFGIPLTLLTITNIGSAMAMAFRFTYRNALNTLCCLCCRHSFVRALTSQPPEEFPPLPASDDEDLDPEKNSPPPVVLAKPDWRKNLALITTDMDVIAKVIVPIPVTILLIAGYIGLGAMLFGIWEGWDLF